VALGKLRALKQTQGFDPKKNLRKANSPRTSGGYCLLQSVGSLGEIGARLDNATGLSYRSVLEAIVYQTLNFFGVVHG